MTKHTMVTQRHDVHVAGKHTYLQAHTALPRHLLCAHAMHVPSQHTVQSAPFRVNVHQRCLALPVLQLHLQVCLGSLMGASLYMVPHY